MIQATPAEIFSAQYSHCTSGKPRVAHFSMCPSCYYLACQIPKSFLCWDGRISVYIGPRQTSLAKKRNWSRFYSTSSKSIKPWEINYKYLTETIPKWTRLQTLTSHLSTGIGWDWIFIICLSFSLPRKYSFPFPVELTVNVNLMTAIEPQNWNKIQAHFYSGRTEYQT